MPAGRPPKPRVLKIANGNPGKRPLNDREPTPEISAPTMPTWLARRAKVEWKRIVPILLNLGLLTRLDLAALAGYCQSFADFERSSREIEKYGVTILRDVFDRHGAKVGSKRVVNPAVAIQTAASGRLKAYIAEFGLSPSARSRVKAIPPPAPAADPAEEFLKGTG